MAVMSFRLGTRASIADINVRALEAELRSTVDGEVRFDLASKAVYSTDASNYRQIPIGVVVPRSKDAVETAVAACRHYGAPIVSRGTGTSLGGQACNTAVVLDFSKYMNRVPEVDPERRIARVEPGAILDQLRGETESRYRLTFGPDPATHAYCTFGGMIGNNSCGLHSLMAGCTADNVEELEILTYDGLRTRVGATSDEELDRILNQGGRKAQIYERLNDLRWRCGELVRANAPSVPHSASGYRLQSLLPENGFHVARSLAGSQGTCAILLEATVRLVYSPPGRALLVLGYPDIFTAGNHVMDILPYKPVGLEGMDDTLINWLGLKGMYGAGTSLLPDGKGWLIVEFAGESRREAEEMAHAVMEMLRHVPQPPDTRLYSDPTQMQHLLKLRESGLRSTSHVPGTPPTWPGWEDAAVPPEKIGSYLGDFHALLGQYGYHAALHGHFGTGCVHCRISFDLETQDGIRKWTRFLNDAADLVVRYEGTLSAEHGDGQSRAALLPKLYGPDIMTAFRDFKSIWDPEWKMNPGKVIDPARPGQHLRPGAEFVPHIGKTQFRYPDDHGSFAHAVMRCTGIGDCRRTGNVFMCPSFVATREEEHTTRGRARALFEMMENRPITNGWKSTAVLKTLDLCLACMGCKKECPNQVDMATYKSEFLSHHYAGRPHPREAYSMGLISLWAEIGMKAPHLMNLLTHMPGLQAVAKSVAGISRERSIPRFAKESFTQWHRSHRSPGTKGRAVVLYPDVFNNCFSPQTLNAAQRVLEHWGFRVLVPRRQSPEVRPLINYGMLTLAKKKAREALAILSPYIQRKIPVIILEPGTASVFRNDLLNLMPKNTEARRLSDLVYLLEEFAEERSLAAPHIGGKVIFHGHCHQKAVLRVEASRVLLRRMDLEIAEPEAGCCGMAGSFGMEKRHYTVSMQIADERLLPAIKAAPKEAYVVSDGFSCRQQIKEGSGHKVLHIAELLYRGFRTQERLAQRGAANTSDTHPVH